MGQKSYMYRAGIILALILAGATLKPPPVFTQAVGEWSPVTTWPYRAIHAALLPNGKVLFWDSYFLADNPQLWDPVTNTVTAATKAGYNIFCTGFGTMADGQLFMAGGHVSDNVGLDYAATYNPTNNSWTRLPSMNAGRWYPSLTNLPNGDVLVLSGMTDTTVGANLLPQVWETQTSTWRDLTNAQLQLPYYPFTFVAPNGRIFDAGPSQTTRYLNTAGAGAWTVVGDSLFGTRNWGSAVMYEPGRVLLVGGSQCVWNECSSVTATAEVIDLTSPTPAWRSVSAMANPRKQMNATILPDGRVLATGGSSGPTGFDDATQPAYAAEVWDPSTEQWTTWASATVYRGYHSTALLLPDGRVLQAGGNQGGATAEIFSPPYLFNGPRPTITSSPRTVNYGQTFFVETPDADSIAKVSLIRLSAVTHSFNMSQRFNALGFTTGSGGLNVAAPADPNLAPPGHYLLFILNTSGVPSVAEIVRVAETLPLPFDPSDLTATAASSSEIDVAWNDNATNESEFQIERCQGTGCTGFVQIATVAANAMSHHDSGLTSGTSYSYRVRASNTNGDSAYSNTSTDATFAAGLSGPINLTATAIAANQITLAWTDNATNENGFRIERCQGNGCTSFTLLASVGPNVKGLNNFGLAPSTNYSYRVRAFNNGGNSAYTNTATAVTPAAAVIPAPTSLTATTVSATAIDLTWTDNSTTESGFKIERCAGAGCSNFVQVALAGANATSYQNTGLTTDTPHSYRVRAYNSSTDSVYSNTATAVTQSGGLATPSSLSATTIGATQINLTWTDTATTESGFKIERCEAACTTFAQIATVGPNITSYQNIGLSPATSYSYRVRTFNGAVNSGYSNTASAVTQNTVSQAVTNLTATAISSAQIRLTWTDNATNEAGFAIERCQGTDCTSFTQLANVGPNVTVMNNFGLSPSTSYSYRARAFNSGGNSPYSNTATAVTPAAPPVPAPTNLAATAVSTTAIDLSWTDNATTESGFKIERCAGAGCANFVQIALAGANATSYQNAGLTADTPYSYRVRAYTTNTDSVYSNTATAVTQSGGVAAPSNLSATAISGTQINLTWTDTATTESGFQIERCQAAACTNFAQIVTVGSNITSYQDIGLSAATSYSYRVRAFNGAVNSGYSNTASAVTQNTIPPAPTNLTATAISSAQIRLAWADNATNESGYRIERCLGTGCTSFTQLANVGPNVTGLNNFGLAPSTSYSYRVRAFNGNGDSAYSDTATAVTPAAPPVPAPTNLAATAVSATAIDLSWTDNATTESGFKIERCAGAGCANFAQIALAGANATSYQNTGLTADTSYSYRVRAYTSNMDSVYSNTATAVTLSGSLAGPSNPGTTQVSDRALASSTSESFVDTASWLRMARAFMRLNVVSVPTR